MDAEIRERTRRLGLWLDTSAMSPDQVVDEILVNLDRALVTPTRPT